MATPAVGPSPEAMLRARRQLRRVLLLLGLLDLTVLLLVIGLVLAARTLRLTTLELLLLILGGVISVLGVRVWLAVRLRARSGELN